MRHITVAERRTRLGLRHRLAPGALAEDPAEVADSLVAVHGTDPASVFVGAMARMRDGSIGSVERALYTDRTLIRLLGMRRTVFVVSRQTAPVVQAACSRAVAARERRKLVSWLTEAAVADDVERWLDEAAQAALSALAARGAATAAEIAADDPRLQVELVLARGKSYEGRQQVAGRLLFLLAAEGQVVRGRPRGSWTSHQHQWSVMADWCPGGLAEWPQEDAETELARRWLRAYGPGTAEDLRWWLGWTKAQVKQALTRLRPAEVDLDGTVGLVLPDDVGPPEEAEPWAALLPGLDSTPMGWQQRDWFLGPHRQHLFDGTGNVGPTVWWDGRIVGGWTQDGSGEIVCRLLADVGADAVAAIETAASRLAAAIEPVRLTPRTRGRTWLERELAGQGG
ncbi:MAG: winged helix DNA-binding domain-containing protein [Streptosporangiaceae bacterium]